MSSYAYFVQTCREEHKKKHPDASVNFAEFSKKCSERWKVKYSWCCWESEYEGIQKSYPKYKFMLRTKIYERAASHSVVQVVVHQQS